MKTIQLLILIFDSFFIYIFMWQENNHISWKSCYESIAVLNAAKKQKEKSNHIQNTEKKSHKASKINVFKY